MKINQEVEWLAATLGLYHVYANAALRDGNSVLTAFTWIEIFITNRQSKSIPWSDVCVNSLSVWTANN